MPGDPDVVLLYDEDCGFCVWSAQMLRSWDRRGRLGFVPIQSVEGARLLAPVAPRARLATMHAVTPDGLVRSGGAALPVVLGRLPGGASPARIAAAMPVTTERAYRWVARHREGLGRMLGRTGCRVDPSRTPR